MSVALLQYARYHGLARDFLQFDMFDLIQQTAKPSLTLSKNVIDQRNDFIVLNDVFKKARDEISLALDERPNLTLKDAHFLQNAIKTSLGPQLSQLSQWYLPDHRRMSRLKMKEPLLLSKGDALSDYRWIKSGLDTQILLKQLEQESSLMKEYASDALRANSQKWLVISRRNTSLINQELCKQKLEVARDDIVRLQSMNTISKPQFERFLPTRNKYHPSYQFIGNEHDIEIDDGYLSEPQDDDISVTINKCSANVTPLQPDHFDYSLSVTDQEHTSFVPPLPTGHNHHDGQPGHMSFTTKDCEDEQNQGKEIEKVSSPTHTSEEFQIRSQIDDLTLSQKQLMTFSQAGQNSAESLHKPQSNKQEEISSDQQLPVSSASTSMSFEEDFLTLMTRITDNMQSQPFPRSLSDIQTIKIPVPDVVPGTTSWKWRPDNEKRNLVDSLMPKLRIGEFLPKRESISNDDRPFTIPDSCDLLREKLGAYADFLENQKSKPQRILDSSELLKKQNSTHLRNITPISIGEFDYETDESEECTSTMSRDDTVSVEPSDIASKSLIPVFHNHKTDVRSTDKSKEQPCRPASPSIVLHDSKKQVQEFGQRQNSSHTAFSASASLYTFLELRGRKFKDLGLASRYPAGEQAEDPIHSSQGSGNENFDPSPWAQIFPHKHPVSMNSKPSRKISIPEIGRLRQLCGIIINNSLLHTHYPLVIFLISQHEQGLTLIYRENTQIESYMPDIILNPTTSILITNSQSLTQRALPGQKSPDQTLIEHRVQKLIPSFTTIHLLVLHREETETDPDLKSNKTQISIKRDFQPQVTTFCAKFNLSSNNLEIKPMWIPYYTEIERRKALEAHVWALINEFALNLTLTLNENTKARPSDTCTKVYDAEPVGNKGTNLLMEIETKEEQILVEAGLNWMAAQVVLSIYNLRDIVQMSQEDRIKKLSCIIGIKAVGCINRALPM